MHNIDKEILDIENKMKYALELINMKLTDARFRSILILVKSQILYSEFIYQTFIKNFKINSEILDMKNIRYNSPIELYRDELKSEYSFINFDEFDLSVLNPFSLSSNQNFLKINL